MEEEGNSGQRWWRLAAGRAEPIVNEVVTYLPREGLVFAESKILRKDLFHELVGFVDFEAVAIGEPGNDIFVAVLARTVQ